MKMISLLPCDLLSQMNRAAKRQELRHNKKINKKGSMPLNNKIFDTVVFDITPETIDNLPTMIKKCVNDRSKLMIFSSEGDNTRLELCEIPHVRDLFRKACLDYGLLGFYLVNDALYEKDEAMFEYKKISMIAYGQIVRVDKDGPIYNMDTRIMQMAAELSLNKYYDLYGK